MGDSGLRFLMKLQQKSAGAEVIWPNWDLRIHLNSRGWQSSAGCW